MTGPLATAYDDADDPAAGELHRTLHRVSGLRAEHAREFRQFVRWAAITPGGRINGDRPTARTSWPAD
ncbi:hypothetical protein ABZ540_33685 [Nocardia xishanensis]|uniref:hypothetical protein n=1 Tax=Nocardia xishanensis TaxID=238964 RepID=UPI0033F48AAE